MKCNVYEINEFLKESPKRKWVKPKIYLLSVSKTNADVFGDFSDGSLGYTNNS
ncbi:MAG: hypothetical protein AB9846_04725 [Tenuifilaceae bacterium]